MGPPGVGSSLGVSTQPVLVSDYGVLILTAVCTPMACGLPGCGGGVSVHQLGPRWGGSPGGRRARGTEGHSVSFHLGPGAGLVALGPRCQALSSTWLSICGFKMGLGHPGQQDGGQCASFLGVKLWPLLSHSPLVRSLFFNLAALHSLQDLSSLTRD